MLHFDLKLENESGVPRLPKDTVKNLRTLLGNIATKKLGRTLSESTKRCLLSFYNDLYSIRTQDERDCSYLVASYTKSISKELQFINADKKMEDNAVLYRELLEFLAILIQAVQTERNSEAVVAYLKEMKQDIETQRERFYTVSSPSATPASFVEPSFLVAEMPQAQLVGSLFGMTSLSVQADIDMLKNSSTEKILEDDLKGILASLHADTGPFIPSDFPNQEAYKKWKNAEFASIAALLSKIKRPTGMARQESNPRQHVIPKQPRAAYICVVEACLRKRPADGSVLFENTTLELLSLLASYWRISETTRAVLLFSAANNSIINISDPTGKVVDVDTETAQAIIMAAGNMIKSEESLDMTAWPEPDQREWANNIQMLYVQNMNCIRKKFADLFAPTAPRFNPYLILLHEFLEQDPTFEYLEASGLVKKWQRKFTLALGRAIDSKYAEIVGKIPRDNSISVLHVYNVADEILTILKTVNARYKNPFMGFLKVRFIVTKELTTGFGVDLKAILQHLLDTTRRDGLIDSIPHDDAVSLYKMLCDIRHVYSQIENKPFPMPLERFFYPFIENFALLALEKTTALIKNAFEKDPLTLPEDESSETRASSSATNALRIFHQNVGVIRSLGWADPYQEAKLYTILLQGISEAAVAYGYCCLESAVSELAESAEPVLTLQEEESNAVRLFGQVKAAVTGLARLEPPSPYQFTTKTCVLLNDIGAVLEGLDHLEETVNPENVLAIVRGREGEPESVSSLNLFLIKIVRAENLMAKGSDGFSDAYVVLTDLSLRLTIGKTRKIDDDLNPHWNEEFELAVPSTNPGYISVTVWDDLRSTMTNQEILGRTTIHLDPRRFNDSGMPQENWFELDTQGRILCLILMESEKVDAMFSLGRAHRLLVRVRDRIVTLMVDKFLRFIYYSLLRPTLKAVCGSAGTIRPEKATLRAAIVPLGNYLNANLEVLAQLLSGRMLFKVMHEAWSVVLTTADSLLLPPLSSAIMKDGETSGSSALWKSALASLGGAGERPLTQVELEVVFEWLRILCIEFFYANGEGLPLEKLQDQRYQRLLLVPVHYVTEVELLLEELRQLSPKVDKYIKEKNYIAIAGPRQMNLKSKAGTIARSKTIMAQGSSRARAQAKKDIKEAQADPLAIAAETEDVILRVLIAKGQKTYVKKRMENRGVIARSTQTEMLAQAAASGYRIN